MLMINQRQSTHKLFLTAAFGVLWLFVLIVMWSPLQVAAAPQTFEISSLGDQPDTAPGNGVCATAANTCTLRAAIQEANANNNTTETDVLSFSTLPAGLQTIQIDSALPPITQPVKLDGYTKSDAVVGTSTSPSPLNAKLMVQVDGQKVKNATGFVVQSPGASIRGLAVYGFGDDSESCQVEFRKAATSGQITGSYVGVMADGTTKKSPRSVPAICTSTGSSGIRIGGSEAGDRNIIAHTLGLAAVILSGDSTEVAGNYIGLAANGSTDLSGQGGVAIEGAQNTVGGDGTRRNVISGGSVYQVAITGNGNKLQGNYIGTDASGKFNEKISNGSGVTIINNASGNLIGGTGKESGNVIRGVQGTAIAVAERYSTASRKTETPTKNSILGNIITNVTTAKFLGIGELNMGIDLVRYEYTSEAPDALPDTSSNAGPTINDEKDKDTGPNGYINAPVLTSASETVGGLSVMVDLDVADSPIDQYRVEFFAAKSSHVSNRGLAEEYLGSAIVGPGTGQQINLRLSGSAKQVAGKTLTATVTSVDTTVGPTGGFGSTSEFAQNITIAQAPQKAQAVGISLPSWAGAAGAALAVLVAVLFISSYSDYLRHRRPLIEVDPLVHYSYFHHLFVVTVPRLRYRLQSRLPRRQHKPPQLPPELSV